MPVSSSGKGQFEVTSLFKVENGKLHPVPRDALASEEQLEGWIAEDPSIIGLDVLVIGRQVRTDFGGRIDILAMDREGALVLLEMKRDKTPRDVVAQTLDYASWVANLTTRRVHEIATFRPDQRLEVAFRECFDTPLPENLNGNHSMVIVAGEFDASSKRIVEYLAEEHGLSINTAFFNVFEESGQQFLATEWLMDQQEVVERAESRKNLPWTGYYYVNAGDHPGFRSWEDMRKHGFVSAGGGRQYAEPLDRLTVGNPIYVYQRKCGYVGYGIVRSPAVKSKDFRLPDGKFLNEIEDDLVEPGLLHDPGNDDLIDYVVGVDWVKTVAMEDAKTFHGVFANQNIVCKLRHPATLGFLADEFGNRDTVPPRASGKS